MSSNLIVNFPGCDGVQFADMSEVLVVKRIVDEADASNFWYTRQDYKAMEVDAKRAVWQARIRLHSLLSKKSGMKEQNEGADGVDPLLLLDGHVLTGIEHLLTPCSIKRTKTNRAQYLQAVLEAQETARQGSATREVDPYIIASLARRHSRSAAKRALKIGALQAKNKE